MQLVLEVAIAAWSMAAVGFAIWTYYDAWLLAFSRGWAAVSLVGGPVGLLVYVLRSRYFGMRKTLGPLPEYEFRNVGEGAVEATSVVAPQEKASQVSVGKPTPPAEFEATKLSQGLPRCPRCSNAVSYYDVKCMRCGQLIKPAAAGSSF